MLWVGWFGFNAGTFVYAFGGFSYPVMSPSSCSFLLPSVSLFYPSSYSPSLLSIPRITISPFLLLHPYPPFFMPPLLISGSAYGANQSAAYALLATQISTSVSSLTWMLTEWGVRKQPSILGMINGAIAGLVCITPAAGFVDMTGAFFIGFFGGPLCYAGSQLKHYLGEYEVERA